MVARVNMFNCRINRSYQFTKIAIRRAVPDINARNAAPVLALCHLPRNQRYLFFSRMISSSMRAMLLIRFIEADWALSISTACTR